MRYCSFRQWLDSDLTSEGKNWIAWVGDLVGSVPTQADSLIQPCLVIGDITNETNIPGMNAAIEAAHAGDAKGAHNIHSLRAR